MNTALKAATAACGPLRVGPDRTDNGEEIGAGLDQRTAIFGGDAADRATRDDRRFAPVAQYFGVGAVLGGLGAARKKRAERDIIGAGLGGGNGAVAARAAGHSDDAVGTEQAPRLGIGHVLFADMDAVAIELGGEVGAVVHDKGDAVLLRDRLQHGRGPPDYAVIDLLQAQLQARHIAAGQCRFEFRGEPIGIERRRRNQIEPGRRCRLGNRRSAS